MYYPLTHVQPGIYCYVTSHSSLCRLIMLQGTFLNIELHHFQNYSSLTCSYLQAILCVYIRTCSHSQQFIDNRIKIFLFLIVSLGYSTQMNYLVSSSALQDQLQLYLSYFVLLFFPCICTLSFAICSFIPLKFLPPQLSHNLKYC